MPYTLCPHSTDAPKPRDTESGRIDEDDQKRSDRHDSHDPSDVPRRDAREPHPVAGQTQHRLLRVSLGLVFLGFGVLKFFPGASPAEALVARTVDTLSLGIVSGRGAVLLTAVAECFIGVTLITGKLLRVGLLVLAASLVGIMSPLVLFWGDMFPGTPTLEAQYVFKDIVLAATEPAVPGLPRRLDLLRGHVQRDGVGPVSQLLPRPGLRVHRGNVHDQRQRPAWHGLPRLPGRNPEGVHLPDRHLLTGSVEGPSTPDIVAGVDGPTSALNAGEGRHGRGSPSRLDAEDHRAVGDVVGSVGLLEPEPVLRVRRHLYVVRTAASHRAGARRDRSIAMLLPSRLSGSLWCFCSRVSVPCSRRCTARCAGRRWPA